MSSASASSISSASTSASSDWWCGGSGQVKWLTDVVAGGKSNDWLMQWYGNALCLVLALALALALALEIRATWRNFRYLIFLHLFVCSLREGGWLPSMTGEGGCGQTLPEPDKGRYASYWNAFLFLVNSNHTNSQWLWKSCPFNAINVTLPITLRYLCSRLVNICRR